MQWFAADSGRHLRPGLSAQRGGFALWHLPTAAQNPSRRENRAVTNAFILLSRQGHRLIQLGIVLLLFTSFQGFAVPYFTVPNLGRSVHTLSAFSGVLLISVGLLWPRLRLIPAASRAAFWFLVYSNLATMAAFLLAGLWGAGTSIMPLAAGGAHGSELQEATIRWVAYSAAPTGITSFALIFWGLRMKSEP